MAYAISWQRPWRRPAKFLSTLVMVVLALALTSSGVFAGRTWCRTDPVVMIGGELADMFVAGPLTAPLQVTGPTRVNIIVPTGVDAWLVLADLGFGRGEVVTFQESADLQVTEQGIEVRVQVYVPATSST